jgi:hypothetical protein
MGTIDRSLPAIAPSVTEILRRPERTWQAEDFRRGSVD